MGYRGLIIGRQTGQTWGKSVVGNLAFDLQKEFPGIGGFSVSNLWRMRVFYEAYAENEKLAPMVREISWTKNILIFEKCKDDLEGENPAIGIILCKDKKKTIVEYALRTSNKPIGVASYQFLSILPQELRGILPSPEQIEQLLECV